MLPSFGNPCQTGQCPAVPSRTAPNRALPCSATSPLLGKTAQGDRTPARPLGRRCSRWSPCHAAPRHAPPRPAKPRPAEPCPATTAPCESSRGASPEAAPVLLSQPLPRHALPGLAMPSLAMPRRTEPCRTELGLTPRRDAQPVSPPSSRQRQASGHRHKPAQAPVMRHESSTPSAAQLPTGPAP